MSKNKTVNKKTNNEVTFIDVLITLLVIFAFMTLGTVLYYIINTPARRLYQGECYMQKEPIAFSTVFKVEKVKSTIVVIHWFNESGEIIHKEKLPISGAETKLWSSSMSKVNCYEVLNNEDIK